MDRKALLAETYKQLSLLSTERLQAVAFALALIDTSPPTQAALGKGVTTPRDVVWSQLHVALKNIETLIEHKENAVLGGNGLLGVKR